MKTSALLCASMVALAAVTLTTNAAFATTTAFHTSHSNSYKAINPSDAAAVSACTKGGGTVEKNSKGQDVCVTPKKK